MFFDPTVTIGNVLTIASILVVGGLSIHKVIIRLDRLEHWQESVKEDLLHIKLAVDAGEWKSK